MTAKLDPVQTAVLQRLLKNGEIWVQSITIKDIVWEVKTQSEHVYES